MAELKTVPKVDYFYDPHEWECTTDDPDIILDWLEENDLPVAELATLTKGPTYFAFRDYHKGTRYFDSQDEAEAAYKKMVAAQEVEE